MRIIASIHTVLVAAMVDVSGLIETVDRLERNGNVKRHGERYTFKAEAKAIKLTITRGTRVESTDAHWSDADFVAAKFAGWHSLLQQAEQVAGEIVVQGLPTELVCLAKLFPAKAKVKAPAPTPA